MAYIWAPDGKDKIYFPDVNLTGGDHFATRQRSNDFVRIMNSLPDPDPILRKMGKGIYALKDLLSDSHMESVWSIRCSSVSGAAWFIEPGANGIKENQAVELLAEQLKNLDISRIIEEMMDAVAYGFSPLEILWKAENGHWLFENIVGKPPEWFEYNQENQLVFKTGAIATEPVPANRFLLARHRASYENPYGVKAFSKCFWPVTFKKNGFRWWTVFMEKYGGAFLLGKYPHNTDKKYQNDLLDALEQLITNSCGIMPEDASVEIRESFTKGVTTGAHREYITVMNSEISKAILGQTLTTEIGDKGTYAAAQAHNLVREDLAAADRRRVAAAFNRLSRVFTFFNFGTDVAAPVFTFEKEEDLKKERVERDKKLYALGFRPKKAYITREYGIPEDEFEMEQPGKKTSAFSSGTFQTAGKYYQSKHHGIKQHGTKNPIIRFFQTFFGKSRKRDESLINEFKGKMIIEGQEDTNAAIEKIVQKASKTKTFEQTFEILSTAYKGIPYKNLVRLVDEIRYAATAVGGAK